MAETLLLDVAYRPRKRIPWQRAIIQVLIDKRAEVVAEYPDKFIRTPSWTVKMPSVIRLLHATPNKRAIKFSRRGIYLRDHMKCQYCGLTVPHDDWEMEHVIPRAKGGKTNWENIVVACTKCNQKKADRTPEQAGMKLLSKPVRPKSLPYSDVGRIMYNEGDPKEWKDWLTSAVYWNSELEKDE